MRQGKLHGDVVLVLGVGKRRGITPTTARRCFEEGAFVFCVDVDPDGAQTVKAFDPELNRMAFTCGNPSTPEEAERIVAECIDHFGPISHVICGAGKAVGGSLVGASRELLEHNFDMNFFSARSLVEAALEQMGDGGSIIFVSTDNVTHPALLEGPYAVPKGAVETMTLHYAAELGERRIRVNAVRPAFVRTWGPNSKKRRTENPKYYEQIAATLLPLPYVPEPDDVSDAIVFLMTNRAITGHVLPLDCGFSTCAFTPLLKPSFPETLPVLASAVETIKARQAENEPIAVPQ